MKDLHTLDKYRDRDFEREYYGTNGDAGNGVFRVPVGGKMFNVVASNGGGWEHVSVSPANRKRKRAPTWEEMCEIKRMFFHEDEMVVEYHPAKSDYVNLHPLYLHLWRPTVMHMPKPPKIFV